MLFDVSPLMMDNLGFIVDDVVSGWSATHIAKYISMDYAWDSGGMPRCGASFFHDQLIITVYAQQLSLDVREIFKILRPWLDPAHAHSDVPAGLAYSIPNAFLARNFLSTTLERVPECE